MEAQIIFAGACAFLNLRKQNDTMGGPAVIAIRAEADHVEHHHISFLAFDTTTTEVSDPSLFRTVLKASQFGFFPFNGIVPAPAGERKAFELEILGNAATLPTVDPSYDEKVAKKDAYWPAAHNQWNRAMVPEPGKKPTKDGVCVYMPLGNGKIAAGKPNVHQWRMPIVGGPHNGQMTEPKNFAREVIYSNFAHDGGGVTIVVKDLETGATVHTLKFTPKNGAQTMTLWIGNNVRDDLDEVVKRTQPKKNTNGAVVIKAEHFSHLNEVAAPAFLPGPIPELVIDPAKKDFDDFDGGGITDGFCGPIDPNGG
jgi:hypothetical protein